MLQPASGAAVQVCTLAGRITADITLPKLARTAYRLSGQVDIGVDGGATGGAAGGRSVTLTIAPGVVVFGTESADRLVIHRGSRINAVGTTTEPIIFTNASDIRGELLVNDRDWGGITILGRAPINNCISASAAGGSSDCEAAIPSGERYGGAADGDSSGALRFVQIKHVDSGGAAALQLGGVGYATTIDHVQTYLVINGDAIRLIGGRVSIKYLAIIATNRKGILAINGYRGTIQFLALRHLDRQADEAVSVTNGPFPIATPEPFEKLPRTYLRMSNVTIVQGEAYVNNTIQVAGGADFALLNTAVETGENGLGIYNPQTAREADAALRDLGPPVFRSVVLEACCRVFDPQSDVPFARQAEIFGSGTNNNNQAHISTLFASLANGPNEAAVPATDPRPFNADPYATTPDTAPNRMTATSHIGAISGPADTSFAGWTCRTSYADFGSASRPCDAGATPP